MTVIDRSSGGDVEQQCGGAISQHLGALTRGLRFGDEALNSRQRRLLADRVDPDAHCRVGGDGASDNSIADRLGDWLRLTGDHRLVELYLTLDDHTVGRYTGSRANQHDIPGAEIVDRHALDGAIGRTRSASSGSSAASAATASCA